MKRIILNSKFNFCSKIQLLETLHPDRTQEITHKLLNKDYKYFIDKSYSKDSSYETVLSELKSFKSSFAHDKESKLNRELIVKSNEAITVLAYHNRDIRDHHNFSSRVSENEVYKVYKAFTKSIKDLKVEQSSDSNSNETPQNGKVLYSNNKKICYVTNNKFFNLAAYSGLAFTAVNLLPILSPFTIPIVLLSAYTSFNFHNIFPQIANVAKKIVFFQHDQTFEIELVDGRKILMRRNCIDITNNGKLFVVTDGRINVYLPVEDSHGEYNIFSQLMNPKLKDNSVDSILLKNGKMIDLTCNTTTVPESALDNVVRDKILRGQISDIDKLKHEEYYIKTLKISDSDVNDYIKRASSKLNILEQQDVEHFFETIGISQEQSKEIILYANRKYHISKLNHLKFLSKEELKDLCSSTDIKDSQYEQILNKLK